jgi:hypothetical protein
MGSSSDDEHTSSAELANPEGRMQSTGGSPQLRLVLRLVGWETHEHTVYYVQVCVETLGGRTWFVRKRYSQFEALRAEMKRSLPRSIKLPKLPGKRLLNSLDPEFIKERARGLSTFVWAVAGNPFLGRLACVQRFLWSDVDGPEVVRWCCRRRRPRAHHAHRSRKR